MTEEQPLPEKEQAWLAKRISERATIDCGELLRAMGGYDPHGGFYDSAQSFLMRNGYAYHIGVDAWKPRKSS